MCRPVGRFVAGQRGLSETQKVILVAVFVVTAVAVTVYLGPYDQQGPVNPQAQWEWTTSDGDVVVTHDGGDGISREALTVVIRSDDGTTEITNLGDASADRIVRPFPDEAVTAGDSLVLDGEEIGGDEIAIVWQSDDRSATLSETEYPPTENE